MDLAAKAERKRKDRHLSSLSDKGIVFQVGVCSSFYVGRTERGEAHVCMHVLTLPVAVNGNRMSASSCILSSLMLL